MKKRKFNKTYLRNVISILVLGVFMYLAMATFPGTNQQKFVYPDGRVEIAKTFSNGNKEIITGRADSYESWQGPTTIEYQDDDGNRTAFEEVNMVDGYRHGPSIITYSDGRKVMFCYEMGERVVCEKSATAEFNTSWEVCSYKYPWFTLKLNVSGFSDEIIQAFMDTFEVVLTSLEPEINDFEELYEETGDVLGNTRFESLISLNSELTLYYGVELSKNSEFRRAVLDQQRSKENSLHTVLKNSYPNYLKMLGEYGVSDADFMAFGHVFDSVMYSYTPLDLQDPYFIDSVDARMYETMMWIFDSGEDDLVGAELLKSADLKQIKEELPGLQKKSGAVLTLDSSDLPPDQVSSIVLSLIFIKFTEADLIRSSVYQWYSAKKGMVILPTATTALVSRNSSSSVTVAGFIGADGGAEVTSRGIVWGTGFNPELTDNTINLGNGSGAFETQINGLLETETYYARSFATNSAGTAYGNCIKFSTNQVTANETFEYESEWKVYPNPAADKVYIDLKSDYINNFELELFNTNGQVVKKLKPEQLPGERNRLVLDVTRLENGIYYLRVKTDDKNGRTQKLLIAR